MLPVRAAPMHTYMLRDGAQRHETRQGWPDLIAAATMLLAPACPVDHPPTPPRAGKPPPARLKDVQPFMPSNPYLARSDNDNLHVFHHIQGCTPRPGYSRFL